MTLFKPRVGKVIFVQTTGGFAVIIPKKIEKIDYLNKRDDRIDKLIWVFCKNGCVK